MYIVSSCLSGSDTTDPDIFLFFPIHYGLFSFGLGSCHCFRDSIRISPHPLLKGVLFLSLGLSEV